MGRVISVTEKTRYVFISHVHEDDDLLPKLKDLIARAGMHVRDSSIKHLASNLPANWR